MKKVCDTCGGSGQISYFKGVSRFLLSWEECPECNGIGYKTVSGKNEKNSKGNKEKTKSSKK